MNIRYTGQNKTERILVQVSRREKAILKQKANEQGLTVSAYIRKICIYEKWDKLFED